MIVSPYSGPWCLTRKGRSYCNIPRCGGEEAANIAQVHTYEDEGVGGDRDTNSYWKELNGVYPRLDDKTAHCGKQSMYFPNSFSRENSYVRTDTTKQGHNNPYFVKDFPYICMAYKIPPTSLVAMLLRVRGCLKPRGSGLRFGEHVQDEQECTRRDEWITLDMTNEPGSDSNSYASGGDWGVIADKEWHYTCLDVLSR